MARWIVLSGIGLGVLAATGLATAGFARAGWNRATVRAVAALDEAASREYRPSERLLADSEAEPLPTPVARYFEFAFPEGRAAVRTAKVRWTGEFRTAPQGNWSPFTATQHFTADRPGFIWDARINMFPLVSVHVRDGYHDGAGTMQARLAGAVPLVDEGGTPEIAQSALARWLGEAVWFPTALLPGGPVRWEPVDDHTARAVVEDGPAHASADFHFARSGEIVRMTALRYRDLEGRAELTPFEGEYADYVSHDGMMVPGRAEVAWLLPEGRFAYWRGRLQSVEYRFLGSFRAAEPR